MAQSRNATKARERTTTPIEVIEKLWSVYHSCEYDFQRLTFFRWVIDLWNRRIVDGRVLDYYRDLILPKAER